MRYILSNAVSKANKINPLPTFRSPKIAYSLISGKLWYAPNLIAYESVIRTAKVTRDSCWFRENMHLTFVTADFSHL